MNSNQEPNSLEQIMQGMKQEELAIRLGVDPSTLAQLKKQANFSQWSKQRDPESVAWQYEEERGCYLAQINFS
ncbi:MAG: hypothetical protein WA865_06625 [Spirulinaceae cyanobacterium]